MKQPTFAAIDPAPVVEARRLALQRIDMSADPLPPRCRMYDYPLVDMICGAPSVLGLKRPDSLTIVYVCAAHVAIGERSLV